MSYNIILINSFNFIYYFKFILIYINISISKFYIIILISQFNIIILISKFTLDYVLKN